MAATERLALLITANGSQAISEFQKTGVAAQTSLKTAGDSTARLGSNLVRVGAGMAAFGAVALVGLYKAAQAAQEEDLAIEKLNNSIANSPALVGASSDAFLDQAAALQDVTKFADDATISAQSMLATFGTTQEEILGLTPLVADLASKFDLDLVNAAKLVGKAMDGNLGALGRYGISVDEAAFATDRFGAITDALREKVGGFAETEGATFNGQLAIMKNNLGDIQEGIGRGAVQAFTSLLGPVKSVSDAFQGLSPEAQATAGKVATFGAVGLVAVGSATMLVGSLLKIKAAYITVKAAAVEAAAAEGAAASASTLGAAGLAATGAAAVTAVAGLALWANSMNDLTMDVEGMALGLGELTDTQVSDFAEGLQFMTEFTGETSDALEQLGQMGELNIESARRLGEAWIEAGGPAEEINTVLDEAAHTAELAALGLDANATSAEELAAKYKALTDSITAYLNLTQSQEEAAAAEAAAQETLFEALLQNGNSFDVNTAKGRENIAARNTWVDTVGAQVTAAIQFAEAGGNEAVAQRRANNAIRSGVADLRAAHAAGLITTEQMRSLTNTLYGIPHNITINVSSNVANVLREFELLVGTISNAGAVAAGHSADFHGVPDTSRSRGESVSVAASRVDRVPYRGSKDAVTPVLVINGG